MRILLFLLLIPAAAMSSCTKADPEKMVFGPSEMIEGTYQVGYELQQFWECSQNECPDLEKRRCWAEFGPNVEFTPKVKRAFKESDITHLYVIGRVSTNLGHYGHLGGSSCQLEIDRIVQAHPVRGSVVRSVKLGAPPQ
jgi:hypothetical protein